MIEQELKLLLLRHWTFFDSISNSNFVVSKLKLWKEPGQKQLRHFLATVGLSLDEAKQTYSFMDPSTRKELKEKILNVCPMFGLNDIMTQTYLLQIDNKT